MATSEERMKILKMIDEGELTPQEGARRLAALAEIRKPHRRLPMRSTGQVQRMMRLRVSDTVTGKTKATVNLPLALVDAGLNIASQYAPGIAFDQLIAAIDTGASGRIIDVFNEQNAEHVEIFIE